jgi:hypothetical protein
LSNYGNLRYTWFARNHGAIGTAGGFAVFPDYPTRHAALSALLHGTSYFNLSIYSAIARYAPPQDNDAENYRRLVTRLTGLDIQHKLHDLTNDEFTQVIDAIQEIEGYVVGVEKPVRRVIGAILKDKGLIAFLIEGRAVTCRRPLPFKWLRTRTSTLSWRAPLTVTSTCARPRIRHRATTF